MGELNIKSTTLEKGLELAKDFVGKLISPTIEEVGFLLSDNIKYFRFKNQIKILLKAREYVKSRNVNPNQIPLKILVPLIENASLEEDEELQEKWSKMIANLACSNENFKNHIFPYLLSQISIDEYNKLYNLKVDEDEFEYDSRIVKTSKPNAVLKKVKEQVEKIEQDGFLIDLKNYEIANLKRLGLIHQLPPKVLFETYGIDIHEEAIEAVYDFENIGYRITELGSKFIEICEFEKGSG